MLQFYEKEEGSHGLRLKGEASMPISLEEKRRFPRIKLSCLLHYKIRGIVTLFNNTISDNLSLGGISFVNNKFIASKTLIMLEINILSQILKPLGRIVWSSALPHSDKYRIGVEFLEMDHQEKNYLKDYIDMQMGKI